MINMRSAEVGPDYSDGGKAHRHIKYQNELVKSLRPDAKNVAAEIRKTAQEFPNSKCLGVRKELGTTEKEIFVFRGDEEVKKVINVPIKTKYLWTTFKEFCEKVTYFGSGLINLGIKKDDVFAIFHQSCDMWQVCSISCMERNITLTTIYASLGHDALVYALNLTKVSAIFTSSDLISKILDAKIETLKYVIYSGEYDNLENVDDKITIRSYDEIIESGKNATVPIDDQNYSADDLALIMFTSGSTGNPKGVLLTHRNILSASAGMRKCFDMELSDEERYLGYLPLAHILEFTAELAILQIGASIGYGTPLTLMDDNCLNENKKGMGDISALKPTIMPAVPLVLDRIRKGVVKKVEHSGILKKTVFNLAYSYKRKHYLNKAQTPLIDKFVFNSIKEKMGGELRLVVSGGAPLSAESQEFMNITFCCPVAQGYGATETASCGALTNTTDVTHGRVGAPFPSCEIRLKDVPEMNYTSKDKPNPRGEILIRGPCVSQGYYNMTDEQKESFQEGSDGMGIWYFTGDIGMWHTDGTLEIIDRKKDLVKLCDGEYIAPGALEAIYGQSDFIKNILIYADSLQSQPVALIVLNSDFITDFATEHKIEGEIDELVKNGKIVKAVSDDLTAIAKNSNLKRCECFHNIMLLSEEWTPQNGLLTEAMKIKRNVLNKKFEKELKGLYGRKKE